MNTRPQILSPVGSFEALQAAVQAQADAVYFGVGHLNMRSHSGANFSVEDLGEISKICQDHQMKTYLTLNTVAYNNELGQIRKILRAAKDNKIDAIIASDWAVIKAARELGLRVHISTQANISNIEAVKFYSQFADAVILARELSLEQITDITKKIKAEKICGPSGELLKVEIFIHGALCMSISGKCFLSEHIYGSSANRGACLQNCRRAYRLIEEETGTEFKIQNHYILSPKDLCAISFLDKIVSSGASILKIEGRARPAEYVKTVTECYQEALASIANKTYNHEKIKNWEKRLKTVFNRGFWEGHYLGKKMGEWCQTYGSQATQIKKYLGKGVHYFDKIKVAEFLLHNNELEVGDKILISGPSTGVIKTSVSEIRIDDVKVTRAGKGDSVSIPLETKIRASDKLFKIIDKKTETI